MKKNEAGGKIVQKFERGTAVEVNKATGSAKNISSRDADVSLGNAEVIGTISDRIISEKSAAKKLAVKKANAKAYRKAKDLPESHRLKFSSEEITDPKMKKTVLKSKTAAKRYEKSTAQIPRQKSLAVLRQKEKTPDGKKKYKTKLVMKEREKISSGRLKHTAAAPVREVGLLARGEMRKSDNTGVESAHFAERTTKLATDKIGNGYRALKFAPHRSAFHAEEKAIKANVNALYQRSIRKNPELKTANPMKKALHKRRIKKQYAKQFRANTAKNTATKAKTAKRTAHKVKEALKTMFRVLTGKWKILGVLIAVLLLLALAASSISSCLAMFGGGFNTIVMTSYTAEDEDILGADADYEAMGAALAAQINNIESQNPGYDEYRYYLDEIGHDPYTLASYLTARYFAYTRAEVQSDLAMLFQQQYELTLNPIVEIRTRTEIQTEIIITIDPDTDEEIEEEIEVEVEVEYEYYILEITLKNKGLQMIVIPHLSAEELEMFRVYQETQGNRPELFENHPHANRGAYLRYEVPPEALSDERFAAILKEAEKFLGWPYVWGGSSPATSFDCSGYVSWVINNSGWNVGRLGARGLFDICTPVAPSEAKPGDLIFFNYTYNAPQPHLPTHVGIYVGGGMMIHCGNPISYASINTPYWTKHFYAFGRLP